MNSDLFGLIMNVRMSDYIKLLLCLNWYYVYIWGISMCIDCICMNICIKECLCMSMYMNMYVYVLGWKPMKRGGACH